MGQSRLTCPRPGTTLRQVREAQSCRRPSLLMVIGSPAPRPDQPGAGHRHRAPHLNARGSMSFGPGPIDRAGTEVFAHRGAGRPILPFSSPPSNTYEHKPQAQEPSLAPSFPDLRLAEQGDPAHASQVGASLQSWNRLMFHIIVPVSHQEPPKLSRIKEFESSATFSHFTQESGTGVSAVKKTRKTAKGTAFHFSQGQACTRSQVAPQGGVRTAPMPGQPGLRQA